ncbi:MULTISPECIES: multidrug effflux MFS transporter [Streptomyces]|uniref:Bcr/CflA family efflux MFS transporter n=1 Tax=Streptomyces albus TaxID=1888 RepID=A0A8H1LCA7_9ACTN|nr:MULTISPECIES: multidrug effflux MFS transporter [Streptomyces]TGG83207.1 Bcr/CflA family efflux MFS transporter [Streptomyces albus]UVN57060.1 Bcr/CflA family efflux MFS transporter [Streptomyces albus]
MTNPGSRQPAASAADALPPPEPIPAVPAQPVEPQSPAEPQSAAEPQPRSAGPQPPADGSGPAAEAGAERAERAEPAAQSARGTVPPGESTAPAAALTRGRRAGLLLTLILGGLTALPPLSIDMYLPALPEVSGALHVPAASAQLTLTACLIGLAVGQLVAGPMSDRFGRRRPLLIGMTGYVLAGVACALAPTAATLTGFRLVQGLTGAAGVVIARAVVRDMYDGLAMARFFSTLMLISGVAPILAPVLGGQVLRFTDWRGVFVILSAIGLLLVLVVLRKLPETLPAAQRHKGGLGEALRSMRGLLADRVFTGYLLTAGLAFAALFSYVSASPFVMQEIYGASPQTFSLLFMINSIGIVAFGQLNGKVLVGRVPLDRVLAFGLCMVGAATVALLVMTTGVFGKVGLAPLATGLCVLMSGMGLIMPNANSQALMRTPHAAGSASALLGTSQFLVGAVASPLVGVAGEHTAVPMALVQFSAVLLAALAFVGLCRPWRARD